MPLKNVSFSLGLSISQFSSVSVERGCRKRAVLVFSTKNPKNCSLSRIATRTVSAQSRNVDVSATLSKWFHHRRNSANRRHETPTLHQICSIWVGACLLLWNDQFSMFRLFCTHTPFPFLCTSIWLLYWVWWWWFDIVPCGLTNV